MFLQQFNAYFKYTYGTASNDADVELTLSLSYKNFFFSSYIGSNTIYAQSNSNVAYNPNVILPVIIDQASMSLFIDAEIGP